MPTVTATITATGPATGPLGLGNLWPLLLLAAVAGAAGVVLALVEIQSIFRRQLFGVIKSGSGITILLINFVFGLITYLIVPAALDPSIKGNWLTAVFIGLGFSTILRSPLAFFKTRAEDEATAGNPTNPVAQLSMGDQVPEKLKTGGIEVISKFYTGLLENALDDADLDQANKRVLLARQLMQKYDATTMEREMKSRIASLQIPATKKTLSDQLTTALSFQNENEKHEALARLMLDVYPSSEIKNLIRRA